MSMLIDGKWSAEVWHPYQASDGDGRFVRQPSTFRNWITADGAPGPTGQGGFTPDAGRYHLYAALICPWASRVLMVRALKGLQDTIGVSIVQPLLGDQGWSFGPGPGSLSDALFGSTHLHEIYTRADPVFTGRVTVPVLWDRKTGAIVSNESADIVRMLNAAFPEIGPDLYPEDLRADIDHLNDHLYDGLNNGVYRAGFAQTQEAYEEAARDVFAQLDGLEERLRGTGSFLFGDRITETDIRAFVTLIRFDAAYHGVFKCNLRRLGDYPELTAYVSRVLKQPGIGETVNIDHIKQGYYSIKSLNPTGIVPLGPIGPFGA
ncbi:MAG: glutathione S-transferase family protein [Rhodospirillum sp.]|nr:glutathione S-transferase family protein [Rhodospirillum sp.]MCF8487765.1 glutathione S-transferase family protein [Rhodospirillum sp.]MCF8501108.1 glutathione S-transferase family protein [Rhodospirillum sp.]